ncbi:MAG: DUF736 family protein [Pseudomonadota bacterium]
MIEGHLTKLDDDAMAGFICSPTFDFDVTLIPNQDKTEAKHPDYLIDTKSPKGRPVKLGAGWKRTSQARNDYISIQITAYGQVMRANVLPTDEENEYRVVEWAQ